MKRFIVFLMLLGFTCPLFAHGDKVIPQVADGQGIIRTIVTLYNISDEQAITLMVLKFKHQDGSAWTLATNQGAASEFSVNLGPRQTMRVETDGNSQQLTAGYAVIVDNEIGYSPYSVDYVLGISVVYEIRSGNQLVDTVSVSVGQPTNSFVFPVDVDVSHNLLAGFAIVNLNSNQNTINLTTRESTNPPTGKISTGTPAQFVLGPGQQRSEFLHQNLFPSMQKFRGIIEGVSSGPVSILALQQTPASVGVQYSTLTPVYRDALRSDTRIAIFQPKVGESTPLDLDNLISDYHGNSDMGEGGNWDLAYVTVDSKTRQLVPQNGATVAPLGVMDDKQFDALGLRYLKGQSYSTGLISISDNPDANLNLAFGVRTNLGQFGKFRIVDAPNSVDVRTGAKTVHLTIEAFIFR